MRGTNRMFFIPKWWVHSFAMQLDNKTTQQHETEVEIDGINCSLEGPRAPAQFCIFLQIYAKFNLQKCCSVFPSLETCYIRMDVWLEALSA